jgi:tol-pal system protein YbgF
MQHLSGHLAGEMLFYPEQSVRTTAMKPYYLFILAALLLLPSCAQNLQNQVDEQGKAITILQRKNQEIDRSLRRLRDDYENDMEKLRHDMKTMRSSSEQKPQQEAGGMEAQGDAAGQPGEAVESVPAGGGAPVSRQMRPAPPVSLTDKDMYNQALAVYNGGDYGKSRKMFNDFLKTHPGSQLAGGAQYWIASTHFKERQYEEAISACDDVIKKYPQGTKTPDAYYLHALAFCEIKDSTTAQIILEDLIQKYPNSEAANAGKQKYEELKSKN